MRRRDLFSCVAVLLGLCAVIFAGCSSSTLSKPAERPLSIDEATQLASVQYDNYQDAGATFRVATVFTATGDVLNLEGEVDWTNHLGHAVVQARGAEAGVVEVYWSDQLVLERRPAADEVLAGLGYADARYIARAPVPGNRQLDRALAIVFGLASSQRENPQLIQQKEGSAFVRTDELRGSAVTVMRYGTRNLYWIDNITKKMLRFEGNGAAGTAPTIVDVIGRGKQTVYFPKREQAIEASAIQELYDALRAGARSETSGTRTGS